MHNPDIQSPDKIQLIISRILSASNSEVNLDELFKYIHNSVEMIMPARNFYIALYHKDRDTLSFPYFVDEYESEAETKPFGKGLTEFVIRKGKSYLVDEVLNDELVKNEEIETIGAPSKIWLGVPLKIQDYVVGAFCVQDYENAGTYGTYEMELLEIISYPVARAIERKLVEIDRLELINKLQSLNEFKDKLFSLISHDLRGPFKSLLGYSEILTSEFDTLSENEKKEYISSIYDSSKNLFEMTSNLLQFSRFQMGRVSYTPITISLGKTVSKCLNLLRGNIVKKQINVFTGVTNNLEVYADEDMLNSVFQNIISNAIKFTARGGEIFITAKYLDDSLQDKVELTIRDTGTGISEDSLKQLFTNKISSTPGTEKEYGTGLGLMLVKEFIDKMGGTISVKSKLNEGTSFIIQLPA